jgi:hypothetical protein
LCNIPFKYSLGNFDWTASVVVVVLMTVRVMVMVGIVHRLVIRYGTSLSLSPLLEREITRDESETVRESVSILLCVEKPQREKRPFLCVSPRGSGMLLEYVVYGMIPPATTRHFWRLAQLLTHTEVRHFYL